jgi:hypothetical protein
VLVEKHLHAGIRNRLNVHLTPDSYLKDVRQICPFRQAIQLA